MTSRINYEDDIFTLALHVRCLHDSARLEIDPEFFRKGILDDIAWLDASIGKIHRNLLASSLFVKRQEHLRALQKLRRSFVKALDDLVENRIPFAQHLGDMVGELRAIRDRQARESAEGNALLTGKEPGTEEEHIVSAEELKFLMTTPEDGGEPPSSP